ncbi:hypothetical protein PPTG_11757 [Phytophthora nicotianae INRA-310]|uniref:Uncharacterized protein n=1 Tax=Phytophthora nicotianae (strain INRA-310) TaxID=761204 RepID=W2Q9X7_PHYN3|nr:hypothetical protein PPTG_11757 [Phytophthora nicotianae INRA-310]ETN09334.1 hypothetical protein PPTG_11757 [Phytophthora nicotianae INRA-310]
MSNCTNAAALRCLDLLAATDNAIAADCVRGGASVRLVGGVYDDVSSARPPFQPQAFRRIMASPGRRCDVVFSGGRSRWQRMRLASGHSNQTLTHIFKIEITHDWSCLLFPHELLVADD